MPLFCINFFLVRRKEFYLRFKMLYIDYATNAVEKKLDFTRNEK